MAKNLLVFSVKDVPSKQCEDLVTQLKMITESMEVSVNIIGAAAELKDPS